MCHMIADAFWHEMRALAPNTWQAVLYRKTMQTEQCRLVVQQDLVVDLKTPPIDYYLWSLQVVVCSRRHQILAFFNCN
jgi:hypothetical protein